MSGSESQPEIQQQPKGMAACRLGRDVAFLILFASPEQGDKYLLGCLFENRLVGRRARLISKEFSFVSQPLETVFMINSSFNDQHYPQSVCYLFIHLLPFSVSIRVIYNM